jgi:site-specific DNA-methyltransferase (adenine-specific)
MYGGGSGGVVEKEAAKIMENWTDKISVFNGDCIELMGRYPDGWFDLCICDPPYGIGFDGVKKSTSSHGGRKAYEFKGWDSEPPKK